MIYHSIKIIAESLEIKIWVELWTIADFMNTIWNRVHAGDCMIYHSIKIIAESLEIKIWVQLWTMTRCYKTVNRFMQGTV